MLVVEHDEDTMLAADCIVDIGPGAGEHGGNVEAVGTAKQIMKCKDSITGAYLERQNQDSCSSRAQEADRVDHRKGSGRKQLKEYRRFFSLGVMTCVTGVSGSGKSSLVNEILYKALAKKLNRARTIPGKHKEIQGTEQR